MGVYINPGNSGFTKILESEYIDKTGLIEIINNRINSTEGLLCVSRPRRFGKSFASKMLCAYYDCTCDSHSLFDDKVIAGTRGYEDHINGYNVIYLDITSFISDAKAKEQPFSSIPKQIMDALEDELRDFGIEGKDLNSALLKFVEKSDGRQIVFIIDEWDALFREAKGDHKLQESYLNLLRGLFKNNNFTPKVVAAAYMTGILPIKKDGSQSAISDFKEFSMLSPRMFGEYVGFTEAEVRSLCAKHDISYEIMKRWYDGYDIKNVGSVYNPNSVMQSISNGEFDSYWTKSSAAESLLTYIDMDMDGLQADVATLIAGEEIEVDTGTYNNDVETFTCKDDVITLLIHLGYLTFTSTFDPENDEGGVNCGIVKVPNEEIRTEFNRILRRPVHKGISELVKESDELLKETLSGNEDAVCRAIAKVRESNYAPTYYNDEQALRYAIKMAYISCVDQYLKIEELPSGHGIADVVFIPKKRSNNPAMVVELKWNKSDEGAIAQILGRHYPDVLKDYTKDVVLVGVNYDDKTKEHSCRIERISN